MKPLVSVVIPTCDRAELLSEAVASVLIQTLEDLEVIVVDDGPTRAARAVVDRIEDSRVRYVTHQSRGSPGAARNHGAFAAQAPLIAFLDDDDLWLPDKLARQVFVFDSEPEVLLVFGRMERFGLHDGVWPKSPVSGRPTLERLLSGNVVPTSSAVVRADAFAAAGGFDEGLRFGEDYELWLRLVRQGPIRALPDVLVSYREHQRNLSRDVDLELRCLATIYRRAEQEWGVPRKWVRSGLRGIHKRRARRARGLRALRHRISAWLV